MASSVFIGYFGGSKISFDGTSITFANAILAPDGSASAPSYSFANDTNTGWFTRIADTVSLSMGGTERYIFQAGTLNFRSDTATLFMGAADDVSLSRSAANRLRLATGDVYNLAPTAFASLPTGAEGDLACVTDSNTATWGATIAGGGANNVIAFFNGTNWTVMGA